MASECEIIQTSLGEFNTANPECPVNIGRELYFAFFEAKARILNAEMENLQPCVEEIGQQEQCKITVVENSEGKFRLGCLICYLAGIQHL